MYRVARINNLPLLLNGLFVLLFVTSLAFCGNSVSAQPVIKGLGLAPLRTELDIAPGTSLDGKLTVINATAAPMTVGLDAEEFSVINQQYDYAFTQESQVAKWVTFTPTTLNLAAGEAKMVSYRLSAPLSAEPGGRYISLFASTDTGNQNNGVSSRQRIASLLYITVLGNVTRSGHLVSLNAPWVMSGGGQWSIALQNTGTTHFRSRYSVNVQDIFGNKVGTTVTGDDLILPGTVRLITDQLPLPVLPGFYRYVYNIGLGDTPAVTETRIVLYASPIFIAAAGVILTLLITLLIRRRNFIR